MRIQVVLTALLALLATSIAAAQNWVEGKDYIAIVPAQHADAPAGKIEVTEVFSYGCPFCAQFNPYMQALRKELPANAVVDYVPASFNAAEDWPMFQRAVCTAQMLGIFDRTNDAMFDAVWKTGELAVSDPNTHELKRPLPTIEDAARYYNKISGIAMGTFLSTAQSFAVDFKMRTDDALMVAYHIESTPTLVVNGKYRIDVTSARGMPQMIEIAKWLVARESK